jgi:WD40 repeat protein
MTNAAGGRALDCRCLAFSPDGRRLAAAQEAAITLWNATSGQELLSLRDHARDLIRLAFSADGQRLLSAGGDGVVKVWDATPWMNERNAAPGRVVPPVALGAGPASAE